MDGETLVETAIVTRLTSEAFDVMAKGLSPGRLDLYVKGLRSKIYRDGRSPGDHVFDVFKRVLDPDRSSLTDQLTAEVTERWNDEAVSREDLILALGTAYYRSVQQDSVLPLETAAWLASLQRDDLRMDYCDLHDSLDERVASSLEFLFHQWDREIKSGFEWQDLALALACIIEGMVRRSLVDPKAVDDDLPARVCLALAFAMTTERTDPVVWLDGKPESANQAVPGG